ncbi:MAG: hypothetical protein OK456_11225 [Thaumarchaeota archaeon]|nr:hypothetical protein [Nitrososphaerota archaeon]
MKVRASLFKTPLRQLVEAAVILGSVLVMSTTLPEASDVPNVVVVLYYVLVPGYCISTAIRFTKTVEDGLFFSVVWSLALLAGVSALQSIYSNQAQVPTSLVVPVIAVLFLVYGHFHRGEER